MSRLGQIQLDFADGTYLFRLPWGQLVELQEKCDAGPYVVLSRLLTKQWRIEDISSTIRLGLIGGGLEPKNALTLTRSYVEARPLAENVLVAIEVLQAAILGVADEQPGEDDAANPAESGSTISQTEN